MEKGYGLEINLCVGGGYGSFSIRKEREEIATIPTMWLKRRSCLVALSFVAYLEQIPEPERAKLEAQMNQIFDDYERAALPMASVVPDFFTEAILDEIMRAPRTKTGATQPS